MILYNINKSVRLYYKEEIHLADGCSSPDSYSCFTLIMSTCRVMDWECFLIQGQHHFLRSLFFFTHSPPHSHSHIHKSRHQTQTQRDSLTDTHHCVETNTHIHKSNKHWLFHWYRCRASVLCCLWHELNMSWFQALLPVVVCVFTAGKYPQKS